VQDTDLTRRLGSNCAQGVKTCQGRKILSEGVGTGEGEVCQHGTDPGVGLDQEGRKRGN